MKIERWPFLKPSFHARHKTAHHPPSGWGFYRARVGSVRGIVCYNLWFYTRWGSMLLGWYPYRRSDPVMWGS